MKVSTPKPKFEKYESCKDSGERALRKIPSGWKVRTVKRVLSDNLGIKIGPFGSQLTLTEMVESGFKVYGQENVTYLDWGRGERYIDENKFHSLSVYQIRYGDVLVTMMGTIGNSAKVPRFAQKGIMDSHLIRLRVNDSLILSDFLVVNFTGSQGVKDQVVVQSRGSTMSGLNSRIVKSIKIAVPPIETQKSILNFLDNKTTQIDSAIEKKKTLIELLKEKRQALITHAVTEGLDLNAKMKDSKMITVSRIPSNWKVKPLWAVTTPRSAKASEGLLLSVYLDRGVIPASEGSLGTHAPSLDMGNYQRVQSGDFVLNNQQAWRGSVGVSTHIGLISPAYVIYKLSRELNPLFANYLMRDYIMVDQFMVASRGVGDIQRQLNTRQLKYAVVPIPPLQDQLQIVEFLDRKIIAIDKVVEKTKLQILKLQEYKSALIYNAVTGKIKV